MLLDLLKRALPRRFLQNSAPAAQGPSISLATALAAYEVGDLDAADRAVGLVLATEPDNARAFHARGLIEYRRRNFPASLAAFRRAVALAPGNADYHYHVAACRGALGDTAQAWRDCEAALALRFDHLPTQHLMAQIALPGRNYMEVLADIHRHLKPRTYLEIGVASGKTIALADRATLAIGVDPAPEIDQRLGANVRIFTLKSDDFFAQHDVPKEFGGGPVDLAFIDGMHHFEFALRDFVAIERCCSPQSTVLVHDCYPLDLRTAARERTTQFWSGDIWRLVLALKKYRRDLAIHTIAAPPTGLALIRRLDPGSRVLAARLDEIAAEFLATDYGVLDADKAGTLNLFPNDWEQIKALLN